MRRLSRRLAPSPVHCMQRIPRRARGARGGPARRSRGWKRPLAHTHARGTFTQCRSSTTCYCLHFAATLSPLPGQIHNASDTQSSQQRPSINLFHLDFKQWHPKRNGVAVNSFYDNRMSHPADRECFGYGRSQWFLIGRNVQSATAMVNGSLCLFSHPAGSDYENLNLRPLR